MRVSGLSARGERGCRRWDKTMLAGVLLHDVGANGDAARASSKSRHQDVNSCSST